MGIEREEVFFAERSKLRSWLATSHERKDGIWAQFYKKSTGLSDLSWEVLVEECLCFGWIDSLPGKVNEQVTKVYISPRKANSGWSRRNKQLLIELNVRGLMHESGLRAIERAKANGSWERFDMAEALVVPAELSALLNSDQRFADAWEKLSDAKRRQFLQQIYDAKTDATRESRILKIRTQLLL